MLNERHCKKITNAEQMFVVPCAIVSTTVKSCMTLSMHCCFIEFEIDLMCFDASVPAFVEEFGTTTLAHRLIYDTSAEVV